MSLQLSIAVDILEHCLNKMILCQIFYFFEKNRSIDCGYYCLNAHQLLCDLLLLSMKLYVYVFICSTCVYIMYGMCVTVCVCVRMCVRMCVSMYVCMYVHCMHVRMYVCMHPYVCIHMYVIIMAYK